MAKTNKTKKKLPAQPAHQKAIIHAKRHGYKYFGFIIAVILLAATYSVAAHAQVAKAKAKPQPAWYYNGAPTASAASAGSVREHIVQLAESQIGQSEHGTNTTKYSSKSLSISRAWCADFVNWVWYNSGAGNNAHLRNGNGREIANWTNYKFGGHGKHRIFDSRRRPTKFEPKPGDAIIFGASLAANEHIGIVVHVYGWNDMDLVEGNAGSTDTQVYLHSHYHPGSCASCGAVYSKPFAYLSPVGDE